MPRVITQIMIIAGNDKLIPVVNRFFRINKNLDSIEKGSKSPVAKALPAVSKSTVTERMIMRVSFKCLIFFIFQSCFIRNVRPRNIDRSCRNPRGHIVEQ
jgi:hypothetical protein